MNKLQSASLEELQEEIKRRETIVNDDNIEHEVFNIFGTICWDGPHPDIEVFKLIKTHDDLPDTRILSLRHKFNSHRHYKCFGIKVTEEDYNDLNGRLNEDNEQFAEWIDSMDLNYFTI